MVKNGVLYVYMPPRQTKDPWPIHLAKRLGAQTDQ